MDIKYLTEAFKYNLTPEEMEEEPVIFMILQFPIEFGKIFLDEIKKEYSVKRYDEKDFFEKLKDIIKEGPGKLSSFSGFGSGISISFSKKEDEDQGVGHANIVLNGVKLTVQINQAFYVFNSKEMTTRQLAKKIIEKIKKLKGYFDYDNHDDEDYAYDIDLKQFKNNFTMFHFSQGTFSYSAVDVSIFFTEKYQDIMSEVKKLANSSSDYSPFEWGRMYFTMNYFDGILDDWFQYFTERGYSVKPHPDSGQHFRVTKVHDLSPEQLKKMNDDEKAKYRERWMGEERMGRYKENEKKAVIAVLTAGEEKTS